MKSELHDGFTTSANALKDKVSHLNQEVATFNERVHQMQTKTSKRLGVLVAHE